jgi:hypothetical protein
MGPPHDDIDPCENFIELDGWPDKMLRPEGEEVELSEAEEKAIMARAAVIEAAGRRAKANMERYAALDTVGSLDEVADAAYERAKALLTRGTPHPVLAKLLMPFTLASKVLYATVWTVAFIVVAPFVLFWRLACWLNGE